MEGILRRLQSLARTASFSGETETGQDLFLDKRTASGQPLLRGYGHVLAQAPSKKSAANVLLRRHLCQPQHVSAQAKLATGRVRVEEEILPGLSLVRGAGGACEALWPSENALRSVVLKRRSPKKAMELDVQHGPQKTRQRKRRTFFPER